jgi:hypothetical protein
VGEIKRDTVRTSVKILAAAILHDGQIVAGHRHHNVIRTIVALTGIKPVTGTQGFLTDAGTFVDRVEAARIALMSGQINKLKFSDTELFSEDLY